MSRRGRRPKPSVRSRTRRTLQRGPRLRRRTAAARCPGRWPPRLRLLRPLFCSTSPPADLARRFPPPRLLFVFVRPICPHFSHFLSLSLPFFSLPPVPFSPSLPPPP